MRGLVVMPRLMRADGAIFALRLTQRWIISVPFVGKMLSTPLKPAQHANQTSSGVKQLKK